MRRIRLGRVVPNSEGIDAAFVQKVSLTKAKSYILNCNARISRFRASEIRLSILVVKLLGEERAGVRAPGNRRSLGEGVQRLAHVRQPLRLGLEAFERRDERLAPLGLVEVGG